MSDIKLPPLTKWDHPEARSMIWTQTELVAIEAYARAAVEADRAARVPMTDEQLREALRACPPDAIEALRVRWLYAKDFAHAVERHHGIRKEQP